MTWSSETLAKTRTLTRSAGERCITSVLTPTSRRKPLMRRSVSLKTGAPITVQVQGPADGIPNVPSRGRILGSDGQGVGTLVFHDQSGGRRHSNGDHRFRSATIASITYRRAECTHLGRAKRYSFVPQTMQINGRSHLNQ